MDLDLQKAGVFKRLSAWLCDFVAFIVVLLCICLLFSTIFGYDAYNQTVLDAYESYGEKYNIDFDITQEEFDKLPEETKKLYEQANKEMNANYEIVRAYAMRETLPLLIISLGLLITSLILEFAIPLLFKNGQTLGKKLFGICVVRTNCVRIKGPVLFIRSILGKCTMETMVPTFIIIMILSGKLGIVGFVVLLLILLLQIVMMIITKTNSTIHDLLADTVVVDLGSQRIFDSEDDLLAYKKKVHEEAVRQARY